MEDLDVLGYHICKGCGNWTPDSAKCSVCAQARGEAASVRVDVEIAGHLVSVGTRKQQTRRGSYRDSTREANVNKARSRAAARLKACFQPIYEAMVAEELARMGEKPIKCRTDAVRRLNRIALDSVTSDQRSA